MGTPASVYGGLHGMHVGASAWCKLHAWQINAWHPAAAPHRLSCRSQQPAASVVAAAPAASDLSAWEAPGLQAGEAKLCSDAQAARLYKGKQLAFPIVHGQYATLVMIPVKLDNEQLTALHALINSLQQLMPGLTSLLPTVENHHPASTPAATTGQAPPVHAPIATSGPSQSHAPNTTARELAPTANGPSQHVPYMEPAAAASAASQKEPALPPRNIAAPSRAPTTAVGSKAVPPAPQPALELPLPHISLSRTVPMAFSKVELLVGGLRDALARTQRCGTCMRFCVSGAGMFTRYCDKFMHRLCP